MTRWIIAISAAALVAVSAILFAAPTVYPTGTTIYDPAQAWNGYTVLSPLGGTNAIVIDMNGKVVKQWDGFNSSAGGPVRILPGGIVLGATGANAGHQESLGLVERDFDGKEIGHFDHNEQIMLDGKMVWALRQHHDWQREDFPAGYYSPNATPKAQGVNMLILTHTNHVVPKVSPTASLEDDHIIEISPEGKVLWEWTASDHIDDFHFSDDARKAIAAGPGPAAPPAGGGAGPAAAKGKGPGAGKAATKGAGPAGGAGGGRGGFDWMHTNSAAYVGPNHWFDDGDKRFAPNNVIVSSRSASFVAIIARDGSIAWQIGPDFSTTPELRAIRQIIGQHNAHFIPKGLPGAGNVMIFDNGGASGYGPPSSVALNGQNIYARPSSRVLEIDPATLKLVWSYTATNFFATNISGAQRLPNGDTLITEGPSGRIFEVNKNSDTVWEYVYPIFGAGARPTNSVYRAYRVPYEWIPQITRPSEKAISPPKVGDFRVP